MKKTVILLVSLLLATALCVSASADAYSYYYISDAGMYIALPDEYPVYEPGDYNAYEHGVDTSNNIYLAMCDDYENYILYVIVEKGINIENFRNISSDVLSDFIDSYSEMLESSSCDISGVDYYDTGHALFVHFTFTSGEFYYFEYLTVIEGFGIHISGGGVSESICDTVDSIARTSAQTIYFNGWTRPYIPEEETEDIPVISEPDTNSYDDVTDDTENATVSTKKSTLGGIKPIDFEDISDVVTTSSELDTSELTELSESESESETDKFNETETGISEEKTIRETKKISSKKITPVIIVVAALFILAVAATIALIPALKNKNDSEY